MRRGIVPKLIKLMAALLSLFLVFAGCGTAGEGGQTSGPAGDATSEPGVATSQRLPDGVLLSIAGTEYRIIRPSNCADEVTNAAVELRLALNAALGVSFGIADDWVKGQSGTIVNSEKEILIGATNRAESAELASKIDGYGYAVAVMGGKLVITATDNSFLRDAVDTVIDALGKEGRVKEGRFLVFGEDTRIATFDHQLQYADIVAGGLEYDVKLTRVITCSPSGEHKVAQGVATDGEYAYFLMRTSSDDSAVIRKYRLSDGEHVKTGAPFYAGHGNDLTYDSAGGRLVAVHGHSEGKILTLLDPETLEVTVKEQPIPAGSGAATYSPMRNIYAISQGGSSLHFLNADFTLISSHTRKSASGYTAQGMGSDENYIYFPMSGSSDNILEVYDWNAEYVGRIVLPTGHESESMCWYDGVYYVNFYTSNGAELYRLEFVRK